MYAIQSGREYMRTFNPVTGQATWTRDKAEAKTWPTWAMAGLYVGAGERVVYLGSPAPVR